MFYNPPGTPPDLRCIGCRYMSSAGLFALACGSAAAARKYTSKSGYITMCCGFAAVACLGGSAVAFRMAKEDEKFNLMRIREHAREIKRKRRESSGVPIDEHHA